MDFGDRMRGRTSRGQGEAERESAGCISLIRWEDIRSEGARRSAGCISVIDERAYKLRAERGRKRASRVHFSNRMRGRTN